MIRAKPVGYFKSGDLNLYTDQIDTDIFELALKRFSKQLGIDTTDINSQNEYTFSDFLKTDKIEITYNPKTHILVAGSINKTKIEQFLGCVPSYNKNNTLDQIRTSAQLPKKQNKSSIISSVKCLFKPKQKPQSNHTSILDSCPNAYHILDSKEKDLIDSYESQLIDMEQFALRKKIVSSYIQKANNSLEQVAHLAETYTISEERNIEEHERLSEQAQFWKEIDYVPLS